ncbi:MAG: hypothetical protein HYS18_01560 [Burkholderiales bacterium]|nr:hypothetical protein [Burkholderiales bacterium]
MNKKLNKHLFTAAFFLGALGIIWIGAGFIDSSFLAMAMTTTIGAAYGFGALELRQFRHATSTLADALAAIPDNLADLNDWLGRVHPTLQNPVRLRIEGERVALPGPALTPYLVGLLVMLGMLGTFLGMVVTLKGAVFALEKTSDLQAIRSALAVPVQGLGLAFGTSVAGVAASAMLGLMSALSRRDRLHAAQLLDTKIATTLRVFSHTHQRQETFKALQLQSQALPAVADKLQAMMVQMESMQQQLNQRLLSNQEEFHSNAKIAYTDLARSVDQSLRESLSQSAHAASESVKPVVEAAMSGITRNVDRSLDALNTTFEQRSSALVEKLGESYAHLQTDQAERDKQRQQAWTQSLEAMAATLTEELKKAGADTTRLVGSAEELMRSRIAAEALWLEQHRERMDQLAGILRSELGALKDAEAARGDAAVERLGELQAALASHLTTLGTALEEPITRLIATASEAPRAAAEVIVQLRQEISNSVARDNALLEERSRIMETLNALLEAINHASQEQRAVIDSLVASSEKALSTTANAFSENVAAEAAKLTDIAANVTSSAVEVSSLSEAFGFAVNAFNEANEKLIANLQRIEGAMDKSMSRSDEQLAYYVAQAREIIDLSMSSQKEIVEELRQITARQAMLAEEAQ